MKNAVHHAFEIFTLVGVAPTSTWGRREDLFYRQACGELDLATFELAIKTSAQTTNRSVAGRPMVRGKFLFAGGNKIYVKGVTYGTFEPGTEGDYPPPVVVKADFDAMATSGINAVRTYTVPPLWLLDLAQQSGLYVMVGIAWEQHVAFLDDPDVWRRIEDTVRCSVRACAGHPAILCFAVGNEIPSSIVRWHGRRRVEHFLRKLFDIVKSEDPTVLVTYVNYPSTEYLQLPFLDLFSFNVFLESDPEFDSYLARLQNLSGNKPVILTEVGLDSARNGEQKQSRLLSHQIQGAFAQGFAGTFVFAWTDDWFRGGQAVNDWQFGLTDRARRPKEALRAVREAYEEVPLPAASGGPRIAVVVCSHNGSRTIRDCCEGILELDYPNFEAVLVDDGSTDATAAIAESYGLRVIRTANHGLSSARNTGMELTTGEIIAYIDDDARPDPQWLRYLAHAFTTTKHAAVGGPNIAPDGDGSIAEAVAIAPGGPVHVLISDTVAEHIPGCNFAVRRSALESIGGFDGRFRVAGDDVDLCWRLQDSGETIGFHSGAVVWHHRRNSLRSYWRQQVGYGRAEALLEGKWPERYNISGHVSWRGRIYSSGPTKSLPSLRSRVYGGIWGTAPFQSIYEPAGNSLALLPLMPEWHLLTVFLGALSVLGVLWRPLLFAVPFLMLSLVIPLLQASMSAAHASSGSTARRRKWRLLLLTTMLHLLQPIARLYGRLRHGLTLWRLGSRATRRMRPAVPRPRNLWYWREEWTAPAAILHHLQYRLRLHGLLSRAGGHFDSWDLQICAGLVGGCARMKLAVEEHAGGKQLVRLRAWPVPSFGGAVLFGALLILTVAAALAQSWLVCAVLAVFLVTLSLHMARDLSGAMGAMLAELRALIASAEQSE